MVASHRWRHHAYIHSKHSRLPGSEISSAAIDPRDDKLTTGPVDMFSTCFYALRMSAMIQIRNVPDALHRQLKSRAALAGMSLSDFLLSQIREAAERPTLEELRARLEHRPKATPSVPPAAAIRAERDRR